MPNQISLKIQTLQKNQEEILEVKSIINEELSGRFELQEERIVEPEDISIIIQFKEIGNRIFKNEHSLREI